MTASADRDPTVEGIAPSTTGRIEMFVEPFHEAQPGPHVTAAVEHLEGAGLDVELGALATVATGPVDVLARAVGGAVERAVAAGATSVQFHLERD